MEEPDDVYHIDGDDQWVDGSNMSADSLLDIRDLLSKKYFRLSLPRTIFQLFILVVGVLGNAILLVICYRRKIKNSAMVYIGALAVVDLFACSVVIPLQIRNTWMYYTYDNVYGCKISEWFKMSTLASSCLLFMAVAVDRHKAICHPFAWRKGGTRRPLFIAIFCILFGMAFMAPELHLIGLQDYSLNDTVTKFDFTPEFLATVDLNLTCHVCEHLNKFDDSWEIFLFLFIALVIFVMLAAVCILSYGRITCVMSANKKKFIKATSLGLGIPANRVYIGKTNRRPSNNLNSSVFESEGGGSAEKLNGQSATTEIPVKEQSNQPVKEQSNQHELSPLDSGQPLNSDRKSKRSPGVHIRPDSRQYSVSKALMVITVVFILTWIPYWAVNIYSLWFHDHVKDSTYITAVTAFIEQLFFLNNAANPLVYLIYSREFRQQCKQLCREITCASSKTTKQQSIHA